MALHMRVRDYERRPTQPVDLKEVLLDIDMAADDNRYAAPLCPALSLSLSLSLSANGDKSIAQEHPTAAIV